MVASAKKREKSITHFQPKEPGVIRHTGKSRSERPGREFAPRRSYPLWVGLWEVCGSDIITVNETSIAAQMLDTMLRAKR